MLKMFYNNFNVTWHKSKSPCPHQVCPTDLYTALIPQVRPFRDLHFLPQPPTFCVCLCLYFFPGDNLRTFLLSAEEKDSRAKGGTDKLQTRDLSQFWINVTGVTSRCCCQANLDLWHNYFSKVWCRSGRSLITFPKSLTNPSFQQGKCSRVAITGSPSRLQPRIKGTRGDTMEAWVSQRE